MSSIDSSTKKKRPRQEDSDDAACTPAAQKIKQAKEIQLQNNPQKIDSTSSPELVDVATVLSLPLSTRLEVRWDVHGDSGSTTTRWWPCTLLPPDGRRHTLGAEDGEGDVSAPIRILDYDPFSEGGFPESSREEVVLTGEHGLFNLGDGNGAHWRLVGSNWNPPRNDDVDQEVNLPSSSCPEDSLRQILDTVLEIALRKSGVANRMASLDGLAVRVVAERIGAAKEKLTKKLLEGARGVDGVDTELIITPENVKKCMEELGRELGV